MADRTIASGFTRDVLPRQVVAESRRGRDDRAARIAEDTEPFGPADDPMAPVFAGGWRGWRTALSGLAFAAGCVGFLWALCALAEACGP
jgi:hypothetical protein